MENVNLNQEQRQMYERAVEIYTNYIKEQLVEDVERRVRTVEEIDQYYEKDPITLSWDSQKTDLQNLGHNTGREMKEKVQSELQYEMLKKLKSMDEEVLPQEGQSIQEYKEQLKFTEAEMKFNNPDLETTFENNEELTREFIEGNHTIRDNIQEKITEIQKRIQSINLQEEQNQKEQTNSIDSQKPQTYKDKLLLQTYKDELLTTAKVMYALEKIDQIEKYNEQIREAKTPEQKMEVLSTLRIDDGNMFLTNKEDLDAIMDENTDYKKRLHYMNFINSPAVKDYKDGLIKHINKADIPKDIYDTIEEHYTKDNEPISLGYQKPKDYTVNPHAAVYINTNLKILKMLEENEKNPKLPNAKKAEETMGEYLERIQEIGKDIKRQEILQYEKNTLPELKKESDESLLLDFYKNDKEIPIKYLTRFDEINSKAQTEEDKIKLTKGYINKRILDFNNKADTDYNNLKEDKQYNPELVRNKYEKQRILDDTLQSIRRRIKILDVATDTQQRWQTKTEHTEEGNIYLKSYQMVEQELKAANVPEMLNKEYSIPALLKAGYDQNEAEEIQNDIINKAKVSQYNIQNGESIQDYKGRISKILNEKAQLNNQLEKQRQLTKDFEQIQVTPTRIEEYREQRINTGNVNIKLSQIEKENILNTYNKIEEKINDLIDKRIDEIQNELEILTADEQSKNELKQKLDKYQELSHKEIAETIEKYAPDETLDRLLKYEEILTPHIEKLKENPNNPNPLDHEEIIETIEKYNELNEKFTKEVEEKYNKLQEQQTKEIDERYEEKEEKLEKEIEKDVENLEKELSESIEPTKVTTKEEQENAKKDYIKERLDTANKELKNEKDEEVKEKEKFIKSNKEEELEPINSIQPIINTLKNNITGKTIQTDAEIEAIIKFDTLLKRSGQNKDKNPEQQLRFRNVSTFQPTIQILKDKIKDISSENDNEERKKIVEASVSKINDKLYDNLTKTIQNEIEKVQKQTPESNNIIKLENISKNLEKETTINLNIVDEIEAEIKNQQDKKDNIETKLTVAEKNLNDKQETRLNQMKEDMESILTRMKKDQQTIENTRKEQEKVLNNLETQKKTDTTLTEEQSKKLDEKIINTKAEIETAKYQEKTIQENIKNQETINKNVIERLENSKQQQQIRIHRIAQSIYKKVTTQTIGHRMGFALKLPVNEHKYLQIKQNIERNQILNNEVIKSLKESISQNPTLKLEDLISKLDKKAIIEKTNEKFISSEQKKIDLVDEERVKFYQRNNESNEEYIKRITQTFSQTLKEKGLTNKPEVTISLMKPQELNTQLVEKVKFYIDKTRNAAEKIKGYCEETNFQKNSDIKINSKMKTSEIVQAALNTLSKKDPELAEELRGKIAYTVDNQRNYNQINNKEKLLAKQAEQTKQNTQQAEKTEPVIDIPEPENYYTLNQFLQDIRNEQYTDREANAKIEEIITENPRRIPIDLTFTTNNEKESVKTVELTQLSKNIIRESDGALKWNKAKFHPELEIYNTSYKKLNTEDDKTTQEDIEKVKKYQERQRIIPKYGESLNKAKELTESDAFDNTGSDNNIDYRNGKTIQTKERDQINTEALANKELNDTIKNPPLTKQETDEIRKIMVEKEKVTDSFKKSISKFRNYGKGKNNTIKEIRAIIDRQEQVLKENNLDKKAEAYIHAIQSNELIRKERKETLTALQNAKRQYGEANLPTLEEYEIYEKLKNARTLEGKSETTKNTVNFIREFNQRTGFSFKKYAKALDFNENEKNYKRVQDTKKWVSTMRKLIDTFESEINQKQDIAANLEISANPEKQTEALKRIDTEINERYKNIENLDLQQYMGRRMTNKEKIQYKIWLKQEEEIQKIQNQDEREAKHQEHIKNSKLKLEKITPVGSKITSADDSKLTALIRRTNTFLADTPEINAVKESVIKRSQILSINLEKSQEYAKQMVEEYGKVNKDKTSQNIIAMAKAAQNRIYEACLPKVNQMATQMAETLSKDPQEIRTEAFNTLITEIESRNFRTIERNLVDKTQYNRSIDGTLEGFIVSRVKKHLVNWSKNTETGNLIKDIDTQLQEQIKEAKTIIEQNQKDNKTGAIIYNTNQEYGLNEYMTENEKITRIINIKNEIQNASRALKHMQDDGNIQLLLNKAEIKEVDENKEINQEKLKEINLAKLYKLSNIVKQKLKSQRTKVDNYKKAEKEKKAELYKQIELTEKPYATEQDKEKLQELRKDLADYQEKNKYIIQELRNLKLDQTQINELIKEIQDNRTIKEILAEHQYPVMGEMARRYQIKEEIKDRCQITKKTPYTEIEDKINKYYMENKAKCKTMTTKKQILFACNEIKNQKNAPGRFERIVHYVHNYSYNDIRNIINSAAANAIIEVQNINTKIRNKGISGTNNAALNRIDKSKTSLDIIMKIDELAKISESQKILLSNPIRKIDNNTIDYLEGARKVSENNELIAKYNTIIRELKEKFETQKIAIKPTYQREGITPNDIIYSLKTLDMQDIPTHEYKIKQYDKIGATIETTLTPKEAQELKMDIQEEYDQIKDARNEKGKKIVNSISQYIYKLNDEVKRASLTKSRRELEKNNENQFSWKNRFKDITIEEIETTTKNLNQATVQSLNESIGKANYNKNSDGDEVTEKEDLIANKADKSIEEKYDEDLRISVMERQKYTLKKALKELSDEERKICDVYTNQTEYNTKREKAALILNKDAKEVDEKESKAIEQRYNEIKDKIKEKMQRYISEEVINNMPKPYRKVLNIYGHENNAKLTDKEKAAMYLDKKAPNITPKEIAIAEAKRDEAERYYKEEMNTMGYNIKTQDKNLTYEDAIKDMKESDQKIIKILQDKETTKEEKVALIQEKNKETLTKKDYEQYEAVKNYAKGMIKRQMFVNLAAATLSNMPKQMQKAYRLYNDKNNETMTDKEKASIYYGVKEKEITPNDIRQLEDKAKKAEKMLEQIMINKGYKGKDVYAKATQITQASKKWAVNTEIVRTVSQQEQTEIEERTIKGAIKKGLIDVQKQCENFLAQGPNIQKMARIMKNLTIERTNMREKMRNVAENVKQNMQTQNVAHSM